MQRILVVEDNPWNARLILDILESLQRFTLLEAENGNDAMTMIRQHLPHLVLLDVMLPDKHGVEVIREVRADPALQHIPIVALTASASSLLERDCRAAGCDVFLTKPFTRRIIVDVIDKLLPQA
ncbi:MAG: response regulator [Anaerolineae bacterium]|jgi:two-component system cell cycle response regulator DivK|nr:response regulator [Anaerolineae bacterium]